MNILLLKDKNNYKQVPATLNEIESYRPVFIKQLSGFSLLLCLADSVLKESVRNGFTSNKSHLSGFFHFVI